MPHTDGNAAVSTPDAEAAYEAAVKRDLKRNFSAHLMHGMLGQTGFRLVNTPTFIPAYFLLLSGGSDFMVGLALALQSAGSTLTPLVGASLIGHRDRVLPVGFWTGALMRVGVLMLALAGLLFTGTTALMVALAGMLMLGLFAGFQGVIFQVLLAKVIPTSRRGRLMGLRNFLAGLVTIVMAWVGGTYLVGEPPTLTGYGSVFLLAFALTSAGLLLLTLVREPRPPSVATRQSAIQHFAGMPAFLRAHPQFTRYVVARTLITLGRMSLPFYILFAGQTIGLSGAVLAQLTIAFAVASSIGSMLWGLLADRHGFRLCLLLTAIIWFGATVALPFTTGTLGAMIVFIFLGASQEGFRLGSMGLAMEFGSREEMPLRVATANMTAELAGAVAPLLGGLIAASLSYVEVFNVTLVCLALGAALLIWGVQEPRPRRR